jgi:hypothetical protein
MEPPPSLPPPSVTSHPPTHPQASSAPISLRTLVNDLLGDSAGNQGVTITTKFICKAIESTHRNINRAPILGNLDLILEKEVQAGHFSKIGPDTYAVPPIQQLPPSLPFVPLPMKQTKQPMIAPPPPPPPPQQHPTTQMNNSLRRSFSADKTDEERKNDLIQETLSKLTSKDSMKGRSPGQQRPTTKANNNKEPIYLTLREKRMAELSKKNARAVQCQHGEMSKKGSRRMVKHELVDDIDADTIPLAEQRATGMKNKRKREEWHMKQGAAAAAAEAAEQQQAAACGRPGSMRKKVRASSSCVRLSFYLASAHLSRFIPRFYSSASRSSRSFQRLR